MSPALIFDLDGTLVDSLRGIAEGLNRALHAEGLPTHPECAVRRFIGNGAWMLARRAAPALDEAAINSLEQGFQREYANTWRDGTHSYPGIEDLLHKLTKQGVPMAVFSNKPHSFTVDIVEALFPRIPFTAVLGHQVGTPRKPDPTGALEIAPSLGCPPAEITFLGDSTIDFETARNAGMRPLLVSWGFHDRSALEQTGAPVLTAVDQIAPALAGLRPNA